MAYGSGTYVRNWRSRSGYRGSTVSQSLIGGLASPPAKRSIWKPLLGLLLVGLFFAPVFAAARDQISGIERAAPAPIVDGPRVRHHHKITLTQTRPSPATVLSKENLRYLLLSGLLLTGLLLWLLVRAIRFNQTVHPKLMRSWQLSFLCKQCGAIFYPPDAAGIVTTT